MIHQAEEPEPEQAAMKKIGSYLFRVSDKIGQGCFSQVYQAINESNKQTVAIKVVRAAEIKSRIAVKLLQQEIMIMKILQHPNVIRCYDVLSSVKNCYMVMELCQKRDLDSLLFNKKMIEEESELTFPTHTLEHIIYDIFKGLEYLGSKNIIHRDLKLANIFIKEGGQAVIADFGFAVVNLSRQTFTDITIGSPVYMSPEGLISQQYGPKSDIWSFGVIIYELLHRYTPLAKCRTEQQLKTNILLKPSIKAGIPSDLESLMKACLTISEPQRISIEQIAKTTFIQRLRQQTEGKKKLLRTLSDTKYSTNTSTTTHQKLFTQELNYETMVSILHYCRLIHKTTKKIKSGMLSQWLLLISSELIEVNLLKSKKKGEQIENLKNVVQEYHEKYIKEHGQLKNVVVIQEITQEIKGLLEKLQSKLCKELVQVLLEETELLQKCIVTNNIQLLEKQSKSQTFLAKK